MVYIFLGIISLVLMLVLLFTDKFATYSEFMSGFKNNDCEFSPT